MHTLLFLLFSFANSVSAKDAKPSITPDEQIAFLQCSNDELQAQNVALQKTIARISKHTELFEAWRSRGCKVAFDEKTKLLYCAPDPPKPEATPKEKK